MTIFAKNVRYLRKKKNLSQDELAEMLGYKSYTTIQKWEQATNEPTFAKAKTLSEILGYSMQEMAKIDLEQRDNSPSQPPKEVAKKLPSDEEHLLNSYRKLNDFGKQVARLNLDGMTKQSDYAILKSDTSVEFSKELA